MHESLVAAGRFLARLAPEHLEELAAQCELEAGAAKKRTKERESTERDELIRGILDFAEKNPDRRPVLRIEGERPELKIEEGGQYYLGGIASGLFEPVKHRLHGKESMLLHLHLDFPYEIIVLPPWFQCLLPVYQIVAEKLILGADVTLITDVAAIRLEDGLRMETGSGIYGVHECGLTLRTRTYEGSGAGRCDSAAPTISTAARPEAIEFTEAFDPGYPYLRKLTGVPPSIHGAAGEDIHPWDSGLLIGDDGAHGSCVVGVVASSAEDGGSVGDGTAGAPGGAGEQGLSPNFLRVTIDEQASGTLRLDTSGGDGGRGGNGGQGGDVRGGRGGYQSRWCGHSDSPGDGGDAGRGGDGGSGGAGGAGGNAGLISFTYPQGQDDFRYLAHARGGAGGRGGSGGLGGMSQGGIRGRWWGYFGAVEFPTSTEASNGSSDGNGSEGGAGSGGDRGWNGRIRINGSTEVTPNQGQQPNQYQYPHCPLQP